MSFDACQKRQVLDVLLTACVGLEPGRGDWFFLTCRTTGVEERQRVCTLPGDIAADRLPRKHAIGTIEPGIDRPGRRLHIALDDVVRRAVANDDLAELLPALEYQFAVFEESSAGHHVVIEDVIERVALPFGPRDVATIDEFRVGTRLPHSSMERLSEITQGPVILKVGRFVQEPQRRTARPAIDLEVRLAIQEAMEQRVAPAALAAMLGELSRRLDERFSVTRMKRLIGPVAAVVIGLDRARPVFVQRQIEAFDWNCLTRQVGERRTVEVGAEPFVPHLPIQPFAIPAWRAARGDPAVLIVRHAIQDSAVPMSQTIIITLIRGQPVAIHLGEEAQVIWKREIPDFEGHVQFQLFNRRLERQNSGVRPGRRFVRQVHLTDQTTALLLS